jgi:hypothetical protein
MSRSTELPIRNISQLKKKVKILDSMIIFLLLKLKSYLSFKIKNVITIAATSMTKNGYFIQDSTIHNVNDEPINAITTATTLENKSKRSCLMLIVKYFFTYAITINTNSLRVLFLSDTGQITNLILLIIEKFQINTI